MALDVVGLIAPLSADQPSGPDLYGDPSRLLIEQAFERSVSDGAVTENSAAEWQDTIDLIIAQCAQTRDLWLPVYLMRAAVRAGQLDMVADAAQLLAELTIKCWDDVHPQLDELGFIGRKTPCESITRIADFLGPLERMPLLVHPRMGSFSGADIDRFREKGAKAPGFAEFRRVTDALGRAAFQEVTDHLTRIEAAIRQVDATLMANADGDTATNFKPTYDVLTRLTKALRAFEPELIQEQSEQADSGDEVVSTTTIVQPTMQVEATYGGSVRNRNDVAKAIDEICSYYAQFEPASPIPFALRRVRDWISLDFMAVLEDIAPGGVDEATKVLMSRRGDAVGGAGWGDESAENVENATDDWSSEESSDDSWD